MIEAKALILDVDGTLLDTTERFYELFNELLEERGKRALEWDEFLRVYIADTLDDVVAGPGSPRREEELHDFWLEFLRKYRAKRIDAKPIPSAREVVEGFAEVPIAIITSCIVPAEELRRELSEHGIAKHVRAVVTGADVARDLERGHHFSKREMFELAARKLGVNPSECVVVGDYWNDIRDAKAIGAKAVAVLTGLMRREVLERFGPDAVIESVSDLPKVVRFGRS